MKILNLFKRKQKVNIEDIRLFFDIDRSSMEHCNDFSKEVHTRKKYYHKVPYVYDASNITIYIAPTFNGTTIKPLKETIRQHDFSFSRYPLNIVENDQDGLNGYLSIYLKDIVKFCTDIHVEIDHKAGDCTTKYIFHLYDDEDDFDIYVVLYSDSVAYKVKKYLLNPSWLK